MGDIARTPHQALNLMYVAQTARWLWDSDLDETET